MKSTGWPANVLTDALQARIEQPIEIWDTTLREGEQTPGVAYSLEEKLAIARLLDQIGVHGLSAGFPAVSEYERNCVREIMRLGLRIPRIAGMARLDKKDVDFVAETGLPWVGLFCSPSDWHLRDKLKMTEATMLEKIAEVVPYAVKAGLKVVFGIEDATRTPLDRLIRVVEAVESAGSSAITIADTVGILVPSATKRLLHLLRPLVKCRLGVHCHNDLGLATANALAALEAGADQCDVTVLGLGERAGNTPLEEISTVLRVKYDLDLGMKLDLLPRAAELVTKAASFRLGASKPILGANVFSHESGIHVHGLLANPICYEPFPPALVGRVHRIIYGKHSGMTSIQHLLATKGIALSQEAERALLERVKETGQAKKHVGEDDVLEWAGAMARREAL